MPFAAVFTLAAENTSAVIKTVGLDLLLHFVIVLSGQFMKYLFLSSA